VNLPERSTAPVEDHAGPRSARGGEHEGTAALVASAVPPAALIDALGPGKRRYLITSPGAGSSAFALLEGGFLEVFIFAAVRVFAVFAVLGVMPSSGFNASS
jgi:hypothetical protein